MVLITVPDGLRPGDAMVVMHLDEEYSITVPDEVGGGAMIEVDLPDVPPTPATNEVLVIVPDGCFESDIFTVDFDGRQFDICVPAGCLPGDEIQVEVPPQPEERQQQQQQQQEEERQQQQQVQRRRQQRQESPRHLVGRRVALRGLVSKSILNGRKGEVVTFAAEQEQLIVCIDGMCPEVAVRMENVEALPLNDEPDPDNDEPPEAPPAGVHYVGDRVLVERSNGRQSLATIVEYEEAFETYTVDVGSGVLKYGVEESFITPYETSNDWAGPQRRVNGRWEGYYVGRRVRIPSMLNSSDDDDKNGVVQGYDDRTGFYHVELDSGVIRRSVLFKHMRVIYVLRDGDVYS